MLLLLLFSSYRFISCAEKKNLHTRENRNSEKEKTNKIPNPKSNSIASHFFFFYIPLLLFSLKYSLLDGWKLSNVMAQPKQTDFKWNDFLIVFCRWAFFYFLVFYFSHSLFVSHRELSTAKGFKAIKDCFMQFYDSCEQKSTAMLFQFCVMAKKKKRKKVAETIDSFCSSFGPKLGFSLAIKR